MNRFLLFEEFRKLNAVQTKQNKVKEPAPNPFDSKKVFRLLNLLAKASPNTKHITEIKTVADTSAFAFQSTQPDDTMKKLLTYKVSMDNASDDPISSIEVITDDGTHRIAKSGVEIKGENDIEVIVNNFIDFTNLYNDGPINSITNVILDINSVEQIKKIINDQNTTASTDGIDVKDTDERKKLVQMGSIPNAKKGTY